jgi:hypothetical protein
LATAGGLVQRKYRSYSPGSRYSTGAMWLLLLVFLCCVCLALLMISGAKEFQDGL